MGNKKIEKKEIKNNKKLKIEEKKLDKKTFKRIKEEFKQYQKYLFGLIVVYIICYFIWFNIAKGIGGYLHSHGYDKNSRTLVICIAILQGLLFSLDGFVTALLKSPFNQMCYAINKSEGIPYKKKRLIITLATRSNEHCKETLKKMGMLTIVTEMIRIFIMGRGIIDKDLEPYGSWLLLSYLIPLIFTTFDMMSIARELKKIEKSQVDGHAKNKPLAKQSD